VRLNLIHEGSGYQIAHVGSLLVTAHTQAATVAMADNLDKILAAQEAKFGRFSVLAVVSGTGIGSPAAGLKERVVAQEKRFEKAIIGAAVCIEAKGLAAVFTRGFLVAYTLVSSHVFELKSFGNIEASVAWLRALPDQENYFRNDLDCAAEVRKWLGSSLAA
jgi:hypothetical protein